MSDHKAATPKAPVGRPPEKHKPPKDKLQPEHSGLVDLPYPLASGFIKVRVKPGKTIDALLAKHKLAGPASLANRPPFTEGERALGLDRSYEVRVEPGREKALVKLLAKSKDDFEGAYMIWTPTPRVTLAPSDLTAGQNYLNWVNIQQAWDRTVSSYVDPGKVLIAVLDSGLKGDHPDMGGCPTPGGAQCGKQFPGWDWVTGPRVGGQSIPAGAATDGWINAQGIPEYCIQGHGTQVASIAAADTNNGIGIAGAGWNSGIIPIKVLNPTCTGIGADVWGPRTDTGNQDRGAPIRKAVALGAHIINMSYDLIGYDPDEALALQEAWSQGVTPIVAAGNEGLNLDEVAHYPCAALYVICVGGVMASDGTRWFTDAGHQSNLAASTGRIDFTAPSYQICGAVAQFTYYPCGSGTSYAAPIVAGVAALMKSCGATPQQQYDALVATAKGAWKESDPQKPLYNVNTSTYGLIDAGAAVTSVCAPPPSPPCTSATIAASPLPEPVVVGTVVTFTGGASSCTTIRYRFYVWDQVNWSLARDWGAASSYNWATSGWTLKAYWWLVDVSANPVAGVQTSAGRWYGIVGPPCTSVAETSSLPDPQHVGTTITWSGSSSGCNTPEYRYSSWTPATGWVTRQDWSSNPNHVWITTGWIPQAYWWEIDARRNPSLDPLGSGSVYEMKSFGLNDPCGSASIAVSPLPEPRPVGTIVTWTGSSTVCATPQYYYMYWNQSTWNVYREWSTEPMVQWTTSGWPALAYYWCVWARGDPLNSTSNPSACRWYGLN